MSDGSSLGRLRGSSIDDGSSRGSDGSSWGTLCHKLLLITANIICSSPVVTTLHDYQDSACGEVHRRGESV